MIYIVSNSLFSTYESITVEKSLEMLRECNVLQIDSETTGLDPHINSLICFQFGNKSKDFQIVVDCTTVSISLYKEILENTFLVGHNLKKISAL